MNIEKKSHWADKYNYYQFLGSQKVCDNGMSTKEHIHFAHKAIDMDGNATFTHEIMVMINGVYSDTIIHVSDEYEIECTDNESLKQKQPR